MDSMAAQLRIRELTKHGLRPENISELRDLAKKVYHQSALEDMILPLMACVEQFYEGTKH
jgi:predicted metal-dependent hydrolase